MGYKVSLIDEREYDGTPCADIAFHYGLRGNLGRVFHDYAQAPHQDFYCDLAYWMRDPRGAAARNYGHHKVVINGRHPTPYFQKVKHTPSRFESFRIKRIQFHRGSFIMLAGMGTKACAWEGFVYEAFERDAIAKIRAVTDMPIVYRPKLGLERSPPIPGTEFSDPRRPFSPARWPECACVVTHHSNVGVDGLAMGIPVISADGVATLLSGDYSELPNLPYPAGRDQFLFDLAHTQWSPSEILYGRPWKQFADEGLLLV